MGLTIKTYLDKDNAIFFNSKINMGRNPITTLFYGDGYSRYILHFDVSRIRELYLNKTYPDTTKLKHVLKLFNCGSIYTELIGNKYLDMFRGSSFDLVLLPIRNFFDEGIGYDYEKDNYQKKDRLFSEEGSNWFKSTNTLYWDKTGAVNEGEVVIASFHFDKGNENPHFDITDYINNIITNTNVENYGLCIKFPDVLENTSRDVKQYIGFFSKDTNTFFEPYVETSYDDFINDDRNAFYKNKLNRLYLYVNIGGKPENLDELPICTIKTNMNQIIDVPTVIQATKGVYYVNTNVSDNVVVGEMLFDMWSNLKFNNRDIDNIELDFVVRDETHYYNIGDKDLKPQNYVINVNGIQKNENVKRGEIRKVNVVARIPNTINQQVILNNLEYRIYVKEGLGEIDVIPYTKVEKSNTYNFFYLDTQSLLTQTYHIDIKIKDLDLVKYQRGVTSFNVVNDETLRYI
jgi:hypothetical protein